MGSTAATKIVLFDLDNTLFDHYHSLRSAISAVQARYVSLSTYVREDLIERYNGALQEAYDKYLRKEITYDEADSMKVQIFYKGLGLRQPNLEEMKEFRAVYKDAYRKNRRATPGSVETLVRLRESGYRIAIVSNGQTEDQTAKAEAIGIRHLVDSIITSEEAGCCKPDRQIFRFAIDTIAKGATSPTVYMIGDSADSDIKGALDAELDAILYSPLAQVSRRVLYGSEIPVIRRMSQLLSHLGVTEPHFTISFAHQPGHQIVEGLGIDLVTEVRHCMSISQATVVRHAEDMGRVLVAIGNGRYDLAMSLLEKMIRTIAHVAMPIDESGIRISYPGQGLEKKNVATLGSDVTTRPFSIRIEFERIDILVQSESETVLLDVATLLQIHCNDLMRDYPRAAVRNLRFAMLNLAETLGIKDETTISGEQLDTHD
jgi:putative hydrolase of the HAD superfamily